MSDDALGALLGVGLLVACFGVIAALIYRPKWQVVLLAISTTIFAFMLTCFLVAIWGGDGRWFATGVVALIVAVILTVIAMEAKDKERRNV